MNNEGVDILCITAHPDDAEIGMGGTLLRHIHQGRSVGLVDLSSGELGTRGSGEIRRQEAEASARVIGAKFRYQLGLPDGFFEINEESLLKVITTIRRHRPRVVFTNAVRDRHPDHGRGSKLVSRACFLSGLRRVITADEGQEQEAHRPVSVYHIIQDHWIHPDFVVDVSDFWQRKMEALACFKSQFYDPTSTEPVSPISVPEFLPTLEGRARETGRLIGTAFGEGFTVERAPGVNDVLELR
ncbi:MAG TPA: bacillithiol biosynthesis deacetylase BshB1 [Flavobacteriales bacterium]|nr:bacillithiol biosynthesis deacetylase BshB1 [Flavobacteriales bacterium]HRN36754.1 bacillithiol biosynthesis deacetylase BshB1 [Flavobacteriales bacterium]HRO40384.1 bacillithiol biosynthesis deacetylase BshB1 [Flavobacteriales bacterium]HRP82514.1 bacillithiol biosynthesis deacetylase BshB1 [Flavobacteriales bacterium]HRQ84453.1 bacillithiol biosynthesis deacetylase BshB1 [Flavobacteriales bacterium]